MIKKIIFVLIAILSLVAIILTTIERNSDYMYLLQMKDSCSIYKHEFDSVRVIQDSLEYEVAQEKIMQEYDAIYSPIKNK